MMNLAQVMLLAMTVVAAIEQESERFLQYGEGEERHRQSYTKAAKKEASNRKFWLFIVTPILITFCLIAACSACCGWPVKRLCVKDEAAPQVK